MPRGNVVAGAWRRGAATAAAARARMVVKETILILFVDLVEKGLKVGWIGRRGLES